MARRPELCLSIPKHNIDSPGKTSKVGKGTNNAQILFARPELVFRNYEIGYRTAKEVPALREDSVECSHEKSNSQGHEGYQADSLEALIIMCAKSRIAEDTARKISSTWAKGIRMLEHWCSFNLTHI